MHITPYNAELDHHTRDRRGARLWLDAVRTHLCSAVAIAAVVLSSPLAAADEFVERANRLYASIKPADRTDLVLIPRLAAMMDDADQSPPPPAAVSRDAARLLYAESQAWPAAEAWAMRPSQRAVLEALDQIVPKTSQATSKAFGMPYGIDGLPTDIIRTGLYADLGDPPMLAAAKLNYMPALERMACLVNIEATRLAAQGRVVDAGQRLVDLVMFARMMADRQMFEEVRWSYGIMADAMERLRDVLFIDFYSRSPTVDSTRLGQLVERLDPAIESALGLDRMSFPEADLIGAEQLLKTVYTARGGVNEAVFPSTMARLGSSDHPFRRFSEAARWSGRGADLADVFDANEMLGNVYSGWTKKWRLPRTDPLLSQPFEYNELERQHDVILAAVPDMSELFRLRTMVQVEAVGTRHAIAILRYAYAFGQFPGDISAVRPAFINAIESDPFQPARRNRVVPPMELFVPMRDQYIADPLREQPTPHEMSVFAGNGVNFITRLNDQDFILYSVGPDGDKDRAEVLSDDPDAETGDYLIWPPVLSLFRIHLIETEQLP